MSGTKALQVQYKRPQLMNGSTHYLAYAHASRILHTMHALCIQGVCAPGAYSRGSAIAVHECCINKGRTLYTITCVYHNKCDRQVTIECQLCRKLQLNILVDLTRNTVPTRRIQHHPTHTLTYHSLQTLLLYTISRLYCYETAALCNYQES